MYVYCALTDVRPWRSKMYKTQFRKWAPDFDKNRRIRHPEIRPIRPKWGRRTRERPVIERKHNPPKIRVFVPVRALLPNCPRSPDRYRNVEVILHSARSYTCGLFDIFTWITYKIIPPAGQPDLTSAWQDISDECFGATDLMKSGCTIEGTRRLHRVCDRLWKIVRHCDPSMMVKIWRIFYCLYKYCSWKRDFELINIFMRYMKSLAEISHGEHHPLFQLFDTMLKGSEDGLLDTLQVSYLGTIIAMESRLGQHHAVVLNMWSNYLKYWPNGGLIRSLVIDKYPYMLRWQNNNLGKQGKVRLPCYIASCMPRTTI
jgi:hypothetical protein